MQEGDLQLERSTRAPHRCVRSTTCQSNPLHPQHPLQWYREPRCKPRGAVVMQEGAVSPEHVGEQTTMLSSPASLAVLRRCHVERCDGVPQETGWCMVHQDRAEILRVGARLNYPVLSYAPGHTTQQGEAAWMQFLQYPQCHRLAELLLVYLKEQYPHHFPQGAIRA
jgi:hypothetical protein